MAVWKEIKSRIKSVKNTGKITKAMELISTVKMRKAQENVLALRPFALATLTILKNISGEDHVFSAYTRVPNTKKELIVLVASNKGLCGGYNVNTFKRLIEHTKQNEDVEYEYITVGKRAREFVLRMNLPLIADFSDSITDNPSATASRGLVRLLLDRWKSHEYDRVSLLYNQYISAITQLPIFKTLFPFNEHEIEEFFAKIVGNSAGNEISIERKIRDLTIEPSPELVFEYAIPMILDAIVHETILEAQASEHAARMVAMKNAKDAAKKKASILTLKYNKARQTAITTEITEIVSGVESMKE